METFVSPLRFAVEKKKEKKIMTIAKLFVLHRNTISAIYLLLFKKKLKISDFMIAK